MNSSTHNSDINPIVLEINCCSQMKQNTNQFNHDECESSKNPNNHFSESNYHDHHDYHSKIEKSDSFSKRNTASNSADINPCSQMPFHLNIDMNDPSEDMKQNNSISVQDAVFSEECDSQSSSPSQSQDLTCFINKIQQSNQNSISSNKQIEDLFNKTTQQNNINGSEINFNDNIDIKQNNIQSEHVLSNYQNKQEEQNIQSQDHINIILIEEIKKINNQEDDDELYSPTLKLNRVQPIKQNSIEERIFSWLDRNGILQVDPQTKREEYYNNKRECLTKMRKLSKPLEDEIKQTTTMGSLRLCKISSSPLFNRRKIINKVPQKQNLLSINDDDDDDCNQQQEQHQSQEQQQQISNENHSQIQNQSEQKFAHLLQIEKKLSHYQLKNNLNCGHNNNNNNLNTNFKLMNSHSTENDMNLCNINEIQNDNQKNQLKIPSSSQFKYNINVISNDSPKKQFIEQQHNQHEQEDDYEIKKSNLQYQSQKRQTPEISDQRLIDSSDYLNKQEIYNDDTDFIKRKSPPNLDIERNSKRKSLKLLNNIQQQQQLLQSSNPI